MKTLYINKKVLVTGGAGFIGSHVVEKLVGLDAQVTVLDNLSTGSLDNLKTVRDQITFIEGDITNAQDCLKAAQKQEILFHCAAFISVPDSINKPEFCYQTNIIGTLNLLDAAQQASVKRFVFSSSAAVYGNQDGVCAETMPCKPESPYGHSKLIGEMLCQEFTTSKKLEAVILRYFNVHGPRQNPHSPYAGVVAKFKETMQKNDTLTVFGDGSQTRDFISVHDIAQANITVGAAPAHLVTQQVFNCATGKSISLRELIERLKLDFPHFNAPILFKPARPGDIAHSQADVAKYQKIIASLENLHENM